MRVALVGTGFIAGAHAAAAAGLPDVEIVAVTDRDSGAADRFATAWGARVVPDVADLLADEGAFESYDADKSAEHSFAFVHLNQLAVEHALGAR